MKLSHIFERLILKFAQDRAAPKRTGRPRALTDTQVVGLLFKLLRTGCQWRELDCGEGSHMAVRRRLELWKEKGVVDAAHVRTRRKKNEMIDEKAELFARVIDLKKAGVHERHLFDFSFRTDGVGAFVLMRKPRHETAEQALKRERQRRLILRRGFWTEEQLRDASGLTLSELAVIGIDPGKYDIIHCVDMDSPYTSAERRRDLRTQQYAARMQALKPLQVTGDEITLAQCNSRTADLVAFTVYCTRRVLTLKRSLGFYGDLEWRRHRRNVYIHKQKSEERLFRRFDMFRKNHRDRLMVLAYGSWGMKTGPRRRRGFLSPGRGTSVRWLAGCIRCQIPYNKTPLTKKSGFTRISAA